MRIVLTNDDGIESPGLSAFAAACVRLGHDVTVAAPHVDLSGAGAAIGRIHADQSIDLRPAPLPDLPDIPAYAVEGPPGLAAMAACLGGFGPVPDLICSGINAGLNTGHSILHSGTVGAALTASNWGVSGLAVSLEESDRWHWDTAVALLEEVLELAERAPAGTVLNLNAPGRPLDEVQGLRWARLDRFGSVRVAVRESTDRKLQMEYRPTEAELDPDSDTALVEAGFFTLTALSGLGEIPPEELFERPPRLGQVQRRLEEAPGRGAEAANSGL